MTDRTLYVLAIPSDAQRRERADARQQTAAEGILDSDVGSVVEIASEPGEQRLEVQFRDQHAEEMVAELEELAASAGIDAVPYHGTNSQTPTDGYYSVERVQNTGRREPQIAEIGEWQGKLTRAGRRHSEFRAVETAPQQVNHPFGNDDRALVGVPNTASKLRWLNPETDAVETPSIVATRNAEFGDVDVVDATASTFSDPTLTYDIDYSDQGKTDPRAWDEHGRGGRTDSNGDLQWQKVFAASHDYDGEAILSNGLVRLRFDESTPSLTVEHWDNANSTWSTTSLGTSDWEFFDLDVQEVGLASIFARVEFRDTTQSPTAFFTLECYVKRGYNDALWAEPGSEGTPTGLKDLLNPVASGLINDPAENVTLVERSRVGSP